jgi:hypothetical protein
MVRVRLGGYLKTAAMSAGDVGDTPLFVVDYALHILRVLILLGCIKVRSPSTASSPSCAAS